MDRNDIMNDEMVMSWLNGIGASENTRKLYSKSLLRYCRFTEQSPTVHIEDAESEIIDRVLPRKQRIRQYMIDFRTMLKETGAAPKTVHNYVSAVKSFYKFYDILVPQLGSRREFRQNGLEENDHRLDKDDVVEMLKHVDIRNRAIILLMVSSGLSQADVLNMKVGDFKRGYDPDVEIATFHVRRIKTGNNFITFTTPEASRAIWDYINLRNQTTDPEYEKNRIRSDEDYLFTSKNIKKTYLDTLDDDDRHLSSSALMDTFRQLARKCGKETCKGGWSAVRAHNLRKLFFTLLLNHGCDQFVAEFWMGHTIDQLRLAYFEADPGKMREMYTRFIPFLSIEDTEVRTIETEEYKELKNEYNVMCQRVKELERKDSEKADILEFFEQHPDIITSIREFVAKKE